MSKRIVLFLITFFCFAAIATAANRNFTLVIDAGHGGGDAGAIGGGGVREKDLTLKFSLAFGRLVEQNYPDIADHYFDMKFSDYDGYGNKRDATKG